MPTPDQGSSPSAKGFFHLAVVYLIWGSTYLAIRLAVREGAGFPPFFLGASRLFVAGVVLLAWGALRGMRVRLERSEILTLALCGLMMWSGANGLVSWAEQRVDSSYAALLMGMIPLWSAGIGALLDWRRPSWRLIVSLLIGFVGLGLLTVPHLVHAQGADVLSILALMAAPIFWSSGSILQTRRPVGVAPLVAAGYLHLFGAGGFLVLASLSGEPLPTPTFTAWGAWGYLVLAGSILGFTSYVRILRLLPMSVAMTFAYVNPVIAVILGILVLREPLSPSILAGMALILVGVWGVFREKYGSTARMA
jgi:drug/metabolite transporter (DMT)-like permease